MGMKYTDFRSVLAEDLLREGLVPTEHVTSAGTKYLMYTTPEDVEILPYQYDPVCGDCGCPRNVCFGTPPFGWDGLVPEEGCTHWDDSEGAHNCN